MLGTILIVILILALLGALPRWSHSRNWGYYPTRRGGSNPLDRCHSPGSRADLNRAAPRNIAGRHRRPMAPAFCPRGGTASRRTDVEWRFVRILRSDA